MLGPVERLGELSAARWSALGNRFRSIGLTPAAYAPYDKLAMYASDPLHAPMPKWHLRRVHEPFAYAMRMLTFWDPVTADEAVAALGESVPLDDAFAAGLLRRTAEGRVVSPFVLQVLGSVYVLSDDVRAGGDAAMGFVPTTRGLSAIVRPRTRAARGLDLGCGAGALALTLAADCDHVVATDINPRAVALAQVNAQLNGLSNVDCRVGDLFAPVRGETFDLIVSQPPFIAGDQGVGNTTCLIGGRRGDEIPLRLLHELAPHLAPGGMAVLFVEWPIVQGDAPLGARVREALASNEELSVLLLVSSDSDIDAHCVRYASVGHAAATTEFEDAAIRRRDHFDEMQIRALKPALSFVRRRSSGAAWTSVVESRDFESLRMSRGRVFARLDANDLAADGANAIVASRLRVPEGVTLARHGDAVAVTLDLSQFGQPMRIDMQTARVLTLVHESDSVGTAIESLTATIAMPAASVKASVLAVVGQALTLGLLEIARGDSAAV